MTKIALCAVIGAAGLACAGQAHALEEVRFGVMAHNIEVIDGKNAGKEDGPNVSAEVLFASPRALAFALSPRPYVMGSVNVSGATSFIAAGLSWKFGAPTWAIEPSFGYAVHDGEVKNPFPNGDPRATAFSDANLLLGSRDLFRTGLSLTRTITPRWSGQVHYEHLSHGQILGSGRNQGVDQLGVRLAYRFQE